MNSPYRTDSNRTPFGWTLLVLAAVTTVGSAGESSKTPVNSSTPKLDAKRLAAIIDNEINAQLQAEKVPASARASDSEFLRRVYLDITGVIPTTKQAIAFLESQDSDKRAKLIDELLASPNYGKHQADIWQATLLPRTSESRRFQFGPMVEWLEESFNKNKPWDVMVRDILTASGPQDKNPAVTFFLANNTVDKMTDTSTKMFLGIQLQCAQCHNHPFTDFKQTDYWGMTAFFMKVQVQAVPPAQQDSTPPSVTEVNNPRRGRFPLPEATKRLPPKFLQDKAPTVNAQRESLRPLLAEWMTSPNNRYFSKAMVNRIWGQMFGRGIVNPIDDMQDENAPSHPKLFQALADQFVANGFDVKYLVRAICNSETYQRSSKPTDGNEKANPALFSRMAVKTVKPGDLFDSLKVTLGTLNGAPNPGRSAAGGGMRGQNATPRVQFVAFFQVDENAEATEYPAGIPQALRLMNGPQFNQGVMARSRELTRTAKAPQLAIETLYLTALSRKPTPAEYEKMLAHVGKHRNEEIKAYSDILWALINSSEFTLNK